MQGNRFSKLVIAVAIAGVLAPVIQSAKADEVIETRRTTTIDGALPAASTSTTTTTTEKSVLINQGAPMVVPVVVSPVTEVITTTTVPLYGEGMDILQTIDVRRTELDRKIVEARAAGTVSEAKAAMLRRELDRIGSEIAFLKGQGHPSVARAISLAEDLDALTVQARTFYTTITFVPIIEGSHFTIFNGRIIQLDDLAVRRIGLENKILDRLYKGRITYDESIELRDKLNKIATLEDNYRISHANGKLSDTEARELYNDFDHVANTLDTYAGRR